MQPGQRATLSLHTPLYRYCIGLHCVAPFWLGECLQKYLLVPAASTTSVTSMVRLCMKLTGGGVNTTRQAADNSPAARNKPPRAKTPPLSVHRLSFYPCSLPFSRFSSFHLFKSVPGFINLLSVFDLSFIIVSFFLFYFLKTIHDHYNPTCINLILYTPFQVPHQQQQQRSRQSLFYRSRHSFSTYNYYTKTLEFFRRSVIP